MIYINVSSLLIRGSHYYSGNIPTLPWHCDWKDAHRQPKAGLSGHLVCMHQVRGERVTGIAHSIPCVRGEVGVRSNAYIHRVMMFLNNIFHG